MRSQWLFSTWPMKRCLPLGVTSFFNARKSARSAGSFGMRRWLGKPIGYDTQRWGYYYTKPLEEVLPVTLSRVVVNAKKGVCPAWTAVLVAGCKSAMRLPAEGVNPEVVLL